jgi:hypothetical protein
MRMNSYIDMIQYIDNIIDLSMTTNLLLTIWLVVKGVTTVWKRILG